MKLPKEDTDGLPIDGLYLILLLFDNFLKNYLITFLYFLGIHVLVQEMDLIDLLKRSFSRYERSGWAHFSIMVDR